MAVQTFQIPQFSLSTTSTTSFDLINGNNQSTTFNVMPFAGIVKRVLITNAPDIGSGFIQIDRYPNGVAPAIAGAVINYSATAFPFTKKIDANVSFDKDDGLNIVFQGTDVTTPTPFYVSLEIEFTLS